MFCTPAHALTTLAEANSSGSLVSEEEARCSKDRLDGNERGSRATTWRGKIIEFGHADSSPGRARARGRERRRRVSQPSRFDGPRGNMKMRRKEESERERMRGVVNDGREQAIAIR